MRYPSIEVLDLDNKKHPIFNSDDVSVFEKMDGGNTQIVLPNEGDITHGLRSGKVNRRTVDRLWVREFEAFFWLNKHTFEESLERGFAYFMEFLAPHKIVYKPEFVNRPFLIDVLDLESGLFLPYEVGLQKTEPVRSLILPLLPIYTGPVDRKKIKELVDEESLYATDRVKEGLVLKDYKTQVFAKAYHPFHVPKEE